MSQEYNLWFPSYEFRTEIRNGDRYVWDITHKRWLRFTPEEIVRQHAIRFLLEQMGAAPGCIVREHPVLLYQGPAQRADIVVFTPNSEPLMLVECKSTAVTIDQQTLNQAVRYNSVIQARYIMLTNGINVHFLERDNDTGQHTFLNEIPNF